MTELLRKIESARVRAAPQPEAQPQKSGWKLAAFPVEWTPGADWFKGWASNWFGPDADDDHLRRAVQELLAAAPSAQAEPTLAELREKLGGWDVPEVSGEVKAESQKPNYRAECWPESPHNKAEQKGSE